MHDTYEHSPSLQRKRRLHAIIFSVFAVVLCAVTMFGLGNTHTKADWQRGGFLNQDFWNANPNTGNIIYSLWGDGTPGDTAYTRTWTGSCLPSNVVTLSSSFSGGTGLDNTIYILNSGNYTLTSPIVLGSCSALIGRDTVTLQSSSQDIVINAEQFIIVDNLTLSGVALTINQGNQIAVHGLRAHHVVGDALSATISATLMIAESQLFNNDNSILLTGTTGVAINNVMAYNNDLGMTVWNGKDVVINNSQFFNNTTGVFAGLISGFAMHSNAIYNNNEGFSLGYVRGTIHDTFVYNNDIGATPFADIQIFGQVKFFNNTLTTGSLSLDFSLTGVVPAGLSWDSPTLEIDTETTDYERVTNPLSSTNISFFTGGILNWSTQRGIQSYPFTDDLRYIFGLNILKQEQPVMYVSGALQAYGSNGADYHTDKYIAELNPVFTTPQMSLVNQYFGSGSFYTQNRSGNGCSLGAFQITTLQPGLYTPYTLQSHTIYILEAGEYRFTSPGTGFTFGGNCIALIGSGDVRIDKNNLYTDYLVSATDKRNIILENLKLDGRYYGNGNINGRTEIGINFAGATYNTTINQVQSYNQNQYGIFLGVGSHHNTIINTQSYNNLEAGIYLYLASHHNVINNTMTYNNSGYGIWFANGSHRNAMNNFQSFNNTVGVFGDLTTKENIINRAMLYNNSRYGLLLKNSSGNILNDIQIYNNTTGIKIELSSNNNIYNGEFKLFDNGSNFDGTTADDGYLAAGSISPFSAGALTLGANLMDCSRVSNPYLSGTVTSLLDTLSGCMFTGQNYVTFNGANALITYSFGTNIYKQAIPYRYDSSNAIQAIPAQYDSGKYIAEIFAIRDTVLENVAFSFSGVIEPSTLYTSQVYTAQVINTGVSIALTLQPSTGGYLIINGNNVGTGGTIVNGDAVQIALTSSSTLNGVVTGSFVNNNTTYSAVLQTKGPDELPSTGSFAFANIIGAALNIYTGSSTTVTDIDTGVLASISTGRIAIYSGGSLVSSGTTGMVFVNNQILAMISSSSQYSSLTTGVVTIGQGSGSFTVRTIPNIYSSILSFTDPVASGAVYSDTISVQASGNTSPVLYKFISNPGDCTSSGAITYSGAITLTTETYNGKYFCAYAELSGYAMPLVSQTTIAIDRTAPTTPILRYPEDDDEIFFVVLERTGVVDSGAGISGYEYQIAEDYNFVDVLSTGFVQTTGTMLSPDNFTETTGDFYRKIRAKDRVGNISARSSQGSFIAIDNEDFIFDEREYAALDTTYTSNEITIDGLRTYGMAFATVDEGSIIKNGVDRGQSTYVQNDDTISIELTSPEDYDESVVSTLTVANRSTDFIIRTAPDEDSCTLSTQDKGRIRIIYDNLIAEYSGDQNRYDQFLYTMRSMLQDEIDLTNDCNLQYLYDLLNGNLHQNNLAGINLTGHIAPNCKTYQVSYDTGKVAFTSPDFKVPAFFANRDALTRYIDSKNPGDCHVSATTNGTWYFGNTDPTRHVAPNGKLYSIQQETQGYTSAEFSVKKYFSTLVALRKYLDSKNPPFPIWSHTVDRTFTPISYSAPNGKTYTIYKTNRGYMSYKLLNVKYYATLDAIKSFINKNNPK